MARPSLKAEKTEIILTAYEHCVARYGVEGATLQRVADAADMARPLLRHYIGNQDDLLRQCSSRMLTRSIEQFECIQHIESVNDFIDMLFVAGENDKDDIAVAWALIIASPDYDFLRDDMQTWLGAFHTAMVGTLKSLYPNADKFRLDAVATGLIAICSNYHTMRDLADKGFLQQSQQASELLLVQLN